MIDNLKIGVHFKVVDKYVEELWRMNKTYSDVIIFPVDLSVIGSKLQRGRATTEKAIFFIICFNIFASTMGTKE